MPVVSASVETRTETSLLESCGIGWWLLFRLYHLALYFEYGQIVEEDRRVHRQDLVIAQVEHLAVAEDDEVYRGWGEIDFDGLFGAEVVDEFFFFARSMKRLSTSFNSRCSVISR